MFLEKGNFLKNKIKDEALVALYIRVSTDAQVDGYSIDAQEERLVAYCKAMGWSNYKIYTDPGFSGSNLNRPKIQELIADAESHAIKMVVVFKLDRLSRSQKDTLFLIEDVFLPNGVDFVSLNESIDTSTPYGRAMIGILSAFAQLERENIYLRTRMGMLERVKSGKWQGGGMVPYGYDYDRNLGTLVPNEDADKVRKMYDLYIKGWSCSKIAKTFGLEYDNHVQKILMRKLNIGIMHYKGEEYKGVHEPLVSEDVYYTAMAKMRERSSVRVTPRGANLLSGLIYCKKCGSRMRYMKNGPTKYRLYCYSRMKDKPYMHKAESCDMVTIDAAKIEEIVINDLFQISFNLQADSTVLDNIATDPLEEMELQINRTQERIKKLYALYVEDHDELLYASIQEQKTKLASLQQEYAIEQENHIVLNRMDSARKTITSLADAWEYMSDVEKQQAVRDCVEKILISEDQVEIYYTFVKNNSK